MSSLFNRKPIMKDKGIEWEFFDIKYSKKVLNYDKWIITTDGSIGCPEGKDEDNPRIEGKYCIISGEETDCDSFAFFRGIEIVSPILTKNKLLDTIISWYSCVMSSTLTYLVNETQGLHVHISHPRLDLQHFLNLWYLCEDVLWSIIPEYRRKANKDYAQSVKAVCKLQNKKIEFNPDEDIKYYAVNTKYYKPSSCRLEIRMYQGTADFTEIICWVNLCLFIAIYSIMNSQETKEYFNYSRTEFLDVFFRTIIKDRTLCSYFISKFNENRDRTKFPNEYALNTDELPTIIPEIRIPRKLQEKILENQAIPVDEANFRKSKL
jgi:hypothetical protein